MSEQVKKEGDSKENETKRYRLAGDNKRRRGGRIDWEEEGKRGGQTRSHVDPCQVQLSAIILLCVCGGRVRRERGRRV